MAGYANRYSGNANKGNTAAAAPATANKSAANKAETLFSTGLFAPEKEGPMVASVQVKETITIPAGSYINVFQNAPGEKTKTGKDAPPFRLSVRSGVLRTK